MLVNKPRAGVVKLRVVTQGSEVYIHVSAVWSPRDVDYYAAKPYVSRADAVVEVKRLTTMFLAMGIRTEVEDADVPHSRLAN